MNDRLHIREIARRADESLERSRHRRATAVERRRQVALSASVVFLVVVVAFAIFLLLFPR